MEDAGGPIFELLRKLAAGRTKPGEGILIGLIGRGIQSSRSPIMHEREAMRLGICCFYILLDFDRLGLADDALSVVIEAARKVGFHGLNVTHPFKQDAAGHMGALSSEASAIGAVNTIVFSGDLATGYNTDSWGFAESFRDGMHGVPLARVVQFGAGGAGAAVSHALMKLGAEELLVIDSQPQRASSLAQRMSDQGTTRIKATTDISRALAEADGIVNTTPIGMAKYPGTPFPADLLERRHWVADIVYFPVETEILKRARALDCRTLSGAGMAIGQAARAFELFTGHRPDRAAMAGHFEAAA